MRVPARVSALTVRSFSPAGFNPRGRSPVESGNVAHATQTENAGGERPVLAGWTPARTNYKGAPRNGAAWVGSRRGYRVIRGGSWNAATRYVRSAYHDSDAPDDRYAGLASAVPSSGVSQARPRSLVGGEAMRSHAAGPCPSVSHGGAGAPGV